MHVARDILELIRTEQKRRVSLLSSVDEDVADDRWLFKDAPFLNELCLMLLIAVRHQVERDLVHFAARAADDGKEIDRQQYRARVQELRKGIFWDRKEIEKRLKLDSCEGHKSIETLRLLANSYKHDPSSEPDKKLLDWLNLETNANYQPLPESPALQERLAESIGLQTDADYCAIAEQFLGIVDRFLADVEKRTTLSPVKRVGASLNPRDFAR